MYRDDTLPLCRGSTDSSKSAIQYTIPTAQACSGQNFEHPDPALLAQALVADDRDGAGDAKARSGCIGASSRCEA
jgi:hypothetical protein